MCSQKFFSSEKSEIDTFNFYNLQGVRVEQQFMHMFFCISLSFNLCVVVRVGSIGSWLALISVMMGTSIYCVVVPTRGRSISLLVMVRFGGMHIDLIYWPLFGRVG